MVLPSTTRYVVDNKGDGLSSEKKYIREKESFLLEGVSGGCENESKMTGLNSVHRYESDILSDLFLHKT